jgi:hypothetical protein
MNGSHSQQIRVASRASILSSPQMRKLTPLAAQRWVQIPPDGMVALRRQRPCVLFCPRARRYDVRRANYHSALRKCHGLGSCTEWPLLFSGEIIQNGNQLTYRVNRNRISCSGCMNICDRCVLSLHTHHLQNAFFRVLQFLCSRALPLQGILRAFCSMLKQAPGLLRAPSPGTALPPSRVQSWTCLLLADPNH